VVPKRFCEGPHHRWRQLLAASNASISSSAFPESSSRNARIRQCTAGLTASLPIPRILFWKAGLSHYFLSLDFELGTASGKAIVKCRLHQSAATLPELRLPRLVDGRVWSSTPALNVNEALGNRARNELLRFHSSSDLACTIAPESR